MLMFPWLAAASHFAQKDSHMISNDTIAQAADWLRHADGLLITAGAGMGVDSGLPDFRGADGFWRAYPALRHERLSFQDMANPSSFDSRPSLA